MDRLDLGMTQHGITGRKIRLNRLSDLAGSIDECLRSGIKTLVAVGNDTTASKVINQIMKSRADEKKQAAFDGAVFGVISVSSPGLVSRCLGIDSIQASIDALKTGKTQTVDVGVLNNRHYFLSAAIFPQQSVLTFLTYSVTSLHPDHQISVCNANIFYQDNQDGPIGRFSCSDGKLEAVIAYRPHAPLLERLLRKKKAATSYVVESVFPIQKITVSHKQKIIRVVADAEKELSAPVAVSLLPKSLKVIIGSGAA